MRRCIATLGIVPMVIAAACEPGAPGEPRDASLDGGLAAPPAVAAESDVPLIHSRDSGAERPPMPPFRFPEATTRGGPVIEHPTVHVITFAEDPRADEIETFVKRLETSSYFGEVTSEYGVGALGPMVAFRLPERAPAELKAGESAEWLRQKLRDGALGTPNPQALYAMFFPKGTVIEEGGAKSCASFGGYHDEVRADNGTLVGFAVLPQCAAGVIASTEMETLTYSASHEIIEWATDPFPRSMPAWNSVNPTGVPWMYAFAAELADLCVQPGVEAVVPEDLGFAVQRSWSNRASIAGHHPCVPSVGLPYVAAVPVTEDQANLTDLASLDQRKVISPVIGLRRGVPRTVKVAIYSDSKDPVDTELFVETYEENSTTAFSLPRSARTGDVLDLTITARTPIRGVERAFVLSVPAVRNMFSWPILLVDEANVSKGFTMAPWKLEGHLLSPTHRTE